MVAELCTEKTKAIVLCSPSNPTGAVLTRTEMEDLLEVRAHLLNVCLVSSLCVYVCARARVRVMCVRERKRKRKREMLTMI